MTNSNTGVVNIRGKEYKTVALRVQEFVDEYSSDGYRIITEIIHRDEVCVVMQARIQDNAGNVWATGHAEEFRAAGMVNKTSALENAETSAIGRALASFGLGGSEFASANEVQGALQKQQLASPEKVAAIKAYLENGVIKREHLTKVFGHAEPDQLFEIEADRIINGVIAKENGGQ